MWVRVGYAWGWVGWARWSRAGQGMQDRAAGGARRGGARQRRAG